MKTHIFQALSRADDYVNGSSWRRTRRFHCLYLGNSTSRKWGDHQIPQEGLKLVSGVF